MNTDTGCKNLLSQIVYWRGVVDGLDPEPQHIDNMNAIATAMNSTTTTVSSSRPMVWR